VFSSHPERTISLMVESLDAWFAREILPHEEALVRYLKRLWIARDDIHDLRQETYIRVYEAAAKSRPQFAKSFLFTTARHLIADRFRRERVVSIEARGDLDTSTVLVDEISPEQGVSAHQELRSVAEAFDRLPPRCREVVWMRRVLDLPQKEVAARLGIAEGMVEKHLAKAMRRFADALHAEQTSESNTRTAAPARDDDHGQQQAD
jgi:RNA polymerase sigma factor (sigma-70 family)